MRTVDIFDEENSIIIEGELTTDTFDFFFSEKKFKVSSSINDDVFYNNSIIEYKISNNPIELKMRTVELFHEPPVEYSIKDGVVLESEILKKKDNYILETAEDRISDLKKQVEWEKIDIFGNYEVNLFILSKHPEIVSKEEYRKFLRQSIEKIKAGVLRVEDAVKQDSHGVVINIGKYGKSIWYPDTAAEKKEMDDYFDLSEEDRKGTTYAKKLEYIEEFSRSLFMANSPRYVGISEHEFRSSTEIVNYIEQVLNNQHITSAQKDESNSDGKGGKMKWLIVITISVIALSWGIWTAIGVFILSSIIISVLSR